MDIKERLKSASGSFWNKYSWLGTEVKRDGERKRIGKVVEDRRVRLLIVDFGEGVKEKIELCMDGEDFLHIKEYKFKLGSKSWMRFYRRGTK